VPAAGGSWLGNAKLLNAGDYAKITELTRQAALSSSSNSTSHPLFSAPARWVTSTRWCPKRLSGASSRTG
jgi:hypothetical protein